MKILDLLMGWVTFEIKKPLEIYEKVYSVTDYEIRMNIRHKNVFQKRHYYGNSMDEMIGPWGDGKVLLSLNLNAV